MVEAARQEADVRAVPSRGRRWLRVLGHWLGRFRPGEAGPPAAGETERQFHDKVFPREIRYVQNRRETVEDERIALDEGASPTVESQLVGLALSGGGIRSATFGLGVLQALERRGVFKFIDYISTVSGGGFFGTSLSTLMSQPARDSKGSSPRADFPFRFSDAEDEEPTVSYLRNNSNYLAPRGPLDYVRVFAVLVRGIILNFLVLLPFLLFSSLIVTLVYGQMLLDRLQQDRKEQLVAELLARDWAGTQSDRPVAGLLEALEKQSLLNEHRGMTQSDIERWLRGDTRRRDGVRRETLPPLLRDSVDTDAEKQAFRAEVTPAVVAERLWLSGALRDPDALREVDAVERAVRASQKWIPKEQRDPLGSPLSLMNLYLTLREEGVLAERQHSVRRFVEVLMADGLIAVDQEKVPQSLTGRAAEESAPQGGAPQGSAQEGPRTDEAMVLPPSAPSEIARTAATAKAAAPAAVGDLLESLDREGLLARAQPAAERTEPNLAGEAEPSNDLLPVDLELWVPEGSRNLRRILQQLYERGMFDPAWLEGKMRESRFAPPLAYWPAYELSLLEDSLLASLDPAERAVLTRLPVDLNLLKRKMGGSVDDAPGLGMLYIGPEGERGRQTLESTFRGKPGVVLPGHWAIPVWAPELRYLGDKRDLHEVLHQLWDHGALSEGWFEERLQDPAYLGQLAQLKAHAASLTLEEVGEPAPLPWTRYLLRVGLLWILLYPLLLTFRRVFRLLDVGARMGATALGLILILASGALVYVILLAEGRFAWIHSSIDWLAGVPELFNSPGRLLMALLLGAFVVVGILPFIAMLVSELRKLTLGLKGASWRDRYERSFSAVLILIAMVAFIEVQPYLIYHYQHLQAGHVWWSLGIGAASLIASMVAGPALASFKRFGKKVVLTIVALLGPLLPALVYIHLVLWVISFPGVYESVAYRIDHGDLALLFVTLILVAHLINLPIDANSTSLHGFYRDRLSRAYLIRTEGDTVVPEDDLPLSGICADHSGAPYQLLNTALNLQGTRDPRLRRRRGDFFQFSRDFIGSKRTGYCETRDLERLFPHVQTSSAMAVSAAAAAPNMGAFTTGPLVVLMALLNIRLGYWIPNPLRVNRWLPAEAGARGGWQQGLALAVASVFGSFRARPGAYLLIKEMLSLMDGDSRMVNLSDGGHMENTGIFELLRRRCQFIIACDAEADPGLKFGGLAALIRYARIDLGIEIDIHPDDLRLDPEGESRQHCALGFIRYPQTERSPSELGFLLFIKSSITGDEDELIAEYRGRSPHFPHESTADQFFDERQFEAYRALGHHIASGLFDGLGRERLETFAECGEWFQSLAVSLSPGLADKVTFADIQSELGSIQRMLREPGFSDYFYEIYPELAEPERVAVERTAPERAERFRNVFHLVNIQLQLMESVFVSSELGQKAHREHPGNRGWMNLFRRWARAPSFRRAYLTSITTYSAPFQQFCRAALGLELDFQWRVLTEAERSELAQHARETGLRSLGQPLPAEGQPLILTVAAPGTEPILIGEALILTDSQGEADVDTFEMRAGYQGAGMRARALMALRRWTAAQRLSLGFSEAAAVATQSEEFDFDRAADGLREDSPEDSSSA